ncbi:MAG: murein biosynthesis integral membrane protein MurJ [Deltaproteobacteria bacterium]|nr:murein biosynthesis integral membrane protein MurJ [Deltaproteobacteria bacterium]
MSIKKNITSGAGIMGVATLVSRVLGFLRDAIIAAFFGAGFVADAFFVAFRVSNLLRRLAGEGALTPSFVPVFTEVLEKKTRAEAERFVSGAFTIFFIMLTLLAVLGVIFAENLIALMSPGFSASPGKAELATNLTRLMFPYMVFIGLMALSMGVLNSFKHFTAPALSPIFFNISIIVSVLLLSPILNEPVYAIAWGVLIGGFLQFVIQLPFLKKYGMLPRPLFILGDPAIKKVFILMAPAALGIGVYQLNNIIVLRFASELIEGSVSYLYYASRLIELPLGIFAVSVATAVLPSLSEFAVKKDYESFKESLSFSLKLTNLVTIPATIGLCILGVHIVELLFARGAFGATEVSGTVFALYFYALGIVPIATSRILVSVFFAMKDSKTPFYVALITVVFNIAACLFLMKPLGHGGLALATTLSALLNMICLFGVLKVKFGSFKVGSVLKDALKSIIAATFMALIVYSLSFLFNWNALGTLGKIIVLGVEILIGVGVYFGVCRVLKVEEVTFLLALVVKKVNKVGSKGESN